MSEELFSSFADLDALEAEKSKVISIFSEIKKGITDLSAIGLKIDNSKGVREFSVAQNEYNAYIRQTAALVKQLQDSEAKLVVLRQKESVQLAENKLRLRELNKEQQERLKLQKAEEGSIEQLSLKYDKAYRIFKGLSETQRESARGQGLSKFLTETDTKLKQLEGSVGNFRRNVGNYAGSLAAPFETLANKLEEIKANLAKGIGIGGNDAAGLQRSAQAITVIESAMNRASSNNATSVTQVKALENAFQGLTLTIGDSATTETGFLNLFKSQVGEAKDKVNDLKDELRLQASDTKGIDNLVGSLNAVAGIAQGAASATALFGINQENAAKVTAKLIAIQGIANSIQQVGTELTRKGTIANTAYTYVQNLVAVATDRSAAASLRLAAASKFILGGFLIGGLAYLIVKYIQLKNTISDAAHQSQILSDINKRIAEGAGPQIAKLDALYAAATNANLPLIERKKAVDEIQKQYPKHFKNINDEIILQGKAADAYTRAKDAILEKARAQAIEGKLSELATKELEAQFKIQETQAKVEKAKEAVRKQALKASGEKGPKGAASTFGSETENLRLLQGELKQFNSTIEESNKDLSQIGKDREFLLSKITSPNIEAGGGGGDAKEKARKIADNTASEILKSQAELAKIYLQREADKNRQIFEDESRSFDDRLDGLKAFLNAQMQLTDVERNYEIASEKIKLKETLAALEEQKKEKGANVAEINKQEQKEIEASGLRLKVIEEKIFDNRIKLVEEFNKDLKKLKDEREDIREDEIKQEEDYEQFTLDQINKARQKQFDANKYWDDKELAEKKKSTDEMRSTIIKASEELQSTVLFFLTSGIDRENAALETRKRILDEDTQRRINQINMLGLTETERIKQTAMVEKQADYEKQQIEKRQRKLAVERAKFEKAANIASIISSTAQAVVSALGSRPFTPYNIALAAIVGGIGLFQLARAAAAPLPQYRIGTQSAKRGLALVSEEGPELMKRNGQLYLTPETPTLMDMAGGEQITPAHLTRDIMNSISVTKHKQSNGLTLLSGGMSSRQADVLISEVKDLKKETSKSRILIHNEQNIESTPYYLNNIKN